jgi:hypothetical protein
VSYISIFNDPTDPYTYLQDSASLSGLPLADVDASAEEYLQFAAADLASGDRRGFINGIGNAKRALHLMIDSVLNAYGLWERNKRLGFPDKLKLLEHAGLFSVSILQTLNLERNVVEHEYKVPTKARVQETVDIGRLMLLVTQRMVEYVSYECLAGWRDGDIQGVVRLDPNAGVLSFFKVEGPLIESEYQGEKLVTLKSLRELHGELSPGVKITSQAMWEHKLGLRNAAEWAPLLRPIVELNNFERAPHGRAVIQDSVLTISVRVSMPREEMTNYLERTLGTTSD